MTAWKRFLYGGIGALMPVLVTIISLDIGGVLSKHEILTTANVFGILIRYIVLFFIGGFIAYLHQEEHVPFKLFEIGIAAPALITSLIAVSAVPKAPSPPGAKPGNFSNVSFVTPAYASDTPNYETSKQPLLLAGILGDIADGITGQAYRNMPYAHEDWVLASDGQIPQGAVVGGQEGPPGRENLYVCRALFSNGVHPGKVRLSFHGCNIGWGGKEYTISSYQVLVGNVRWAPASGGQIPQGAIPAGKEQQPGNEDLFVCRAQFKNGVHPGKIRPAFHGCNIAWGGEERTISNYEVLVK